MGLSENSGKNVLLLAYYFPPCGMGGVQRAAKLAKYLPLYGWNVTIVTVKDILYYQKDSTLLNELETLVPAVDIQRAGSLDPLRLAYIFRRIKKAFFQKKDTMTVAKRPSLFQNVFRFFDRYFFIPDSKIVWFPFAFLKAVRIIRKKHIRAIISTAPPFSTHIIALCLAKVFRIPWIADFRDGWSNNHLFKQKRLYYSINSWLEKSALKTTRAVTCYGNTLVSYLSDRYNCSKDKFICLYNGFDEEDFSSPDSGKNESFTISFIGTITYWSNPGVFLPVIQKVMESNEDFNNHLKLQIIGRDMYPPFIHFVEQSGLMPKLSTIGYLSHKDTVKQLTASHLLLFPITNNPDGSIITGKLFEYIASGIPILAIVPVGEARTIIGQYCKEYCILEDTNFEEASAFIVQVYSRWRDSKDFAVPQSSAEKEAYWNAIKHFSRKYQAQKVAELLNTFIAE